MDTHITHQMIKVSDLIRNAKYAVAFTGAGSSTGSGIPDFRSKGSGLWEKDDPFSVASLTAFKRHPEKFYNWIRPLFLQSLHAKPNGSHLGLAALAQEGFIQSVITQNIDGLHQRAGSSKVIELHGNALTATCPSCAIPYKTQALMKMYNEENKLPTCSNCGRIIKPDVILFEEMLPVEAWQSAYDEIQKADVVLVIGSSLEVYPANTLPEMAVQNGAKLVIVNLSATPMDHLADIVIHSDVTEVIPKIFYMLIS